MIMPAGVSLHGLLRDSFVLLVFVVGFSLGGLWQYSVRLAEKNSALTTVVKDTKKAEKISANVSGAVQTYTEAAVDAGNTYVQASNECPDTSSAEYNALGVLIETSNAAIRDAGKVPGDTAPKGQKR